MSNIDLSSFIHKRGPLVYLAPHSDDAALASTGLLWAASEAGLRVELRTVFSLSAHARGALGQPSDRGPEADLRRVSAARKAEDLAFAAALPGEVEVRWLDRLDCPLRPEHLGKHPTKETRMTEADRAIGRALLADLEGRLSEAALVVGPLGLGGHIDHLIVRDLCAALAARGLPVAFFEDLPYAGRIGEAELALEIERAEAAIGLPLRPARIHDRELSRRKQAALDLYPSQVVEVHRRGAEAQMERLATNGAPAERLWLAHATLWERPEEPGRLVR